MVLLCGVGKGSRWTWRWVEDRSGAERRRRRRGRRGPPPLVGEGNSLLHPVGAVDDHGVGVVFEPDTGCRHVVGDDQVGVLAVELVAGVGRRSSVSAAKPTSTWPSGLRAAELGEDVDGGLEDDLGGRRPPS
jgi:hypothetical protein